MHWVWIVASVAALCWGALQGFAGSMSDDPVAGERAGKQGCIIAAIGFASLILCILHWIFL